MNNVTQQEKERRDNRSSLFNGTSANFIHLISNNLFNDRSLFLEINVSMNSIGSDKDTFAWSCARFCGFSRTTLLIIGANNANVRNTRFLNIITRSGCYGNGCYRCSGFLFLGLATTSLFTKEIKQRY